MSNIIKRVCSEILQGKIVTNDNLEGIILTGSYVHGKTHPKSDIDLFVVIQEDNQYIRHMTFWRDNVLIQIRVYPLDKFVEDCLVHGRKRPAAYACKVIYDKNGTCEDAINRSKLFLKKGPKEIEYSEKLKLVNTIKNEISTLEGLIDSGNLIAANLLINELITMIIEIYNNDNGLWMSNNNYLFAELKQHNDKLGDIIEKIFQEKDVEIKFLDLKLICSLVIKDFDKLPGEYTYDEYF